MSDHSSQRSSSPNHSRSLSEEDSESPCEGDLLVVRRIDENQKDAINRRNGQKPKYLKFFLLVFSKDEAQAQEAQA